MKKSIEFYMVAASPWSYLSFSRLESLLQNYNVSLNIKPIDLFAVFKHQGIKLVSERPQAIQKNRINELKRWKEFLNIEMNIKPKYFPVNPLQSSKLILSASIIDITEKKRKTFELSKRLAAAVWKNEENIADEKTLIKIADESGFNGANLYSNSNESEISSTLEKNTAQALEKNIFGVPSFIYDNEIYWGQDRIDFLERHIKKNIT